MEFEEGYVGVLMGPSKAGPAEDEPVMEGGSNAKSGVDESSEPVLPGMMWLLLLLLAGEEDGQIAEFGRKRVESEGEVIQAESRWVVENIDGIVDDVEGRDDIVVNGREEANAYRMFIAPCRVAC